MTSSPLDDNLKVGNSYWHSTIKEFALFNAYDVSYAGRVAEHAGAIHAEEVLVLTPKTSGGSVAIFLQDNGPDEVLSYTRIR